MSGVSVLTRFFEFKRTADAVDKTFLNSDRCNGVKRQHMHSIASVKRPKIDVYMAFEILPVVVGTATCL